MLRHRFALSALVPVALALAAAPAAAGSVQVWDATTSNWSNNGIAHLTGPTVLIYLGMNWPCTADLTVTVSAGVAQVTAVSFSGSSACSGITPALLPWPATPATTAYAGANPPFAGAPTLAPVLWSLAISGVHLTVAGPPTINCPATTATIGGVIDVADQAGAPPATPTANRFVFRGMLGPCSLQTRNTLALVAAPALRILP
ncbi:hypothetical protein ABIE09_001898 [Lysobacter enzymogenes]|uniref:hypothetical protein n=1 Tax=Lysobacter enzymogenes TaxID=69 RepID=UPI00339A621A